LFETRTKKLVAAKHEARLNALLGPPTAPRCWRCRPRSQESF